MPDLAALRSRLDALPLDRAPLRRAGLLSVLLVVLLVGGKVFGPDRAARQPAAADRQEAPVAENASVPSGWTGGRVLAVLLLAAGGGVAFVLHRRAAPGPATDSALDVIATHTLGPGQALRLVGCGDDVLLLSATGEAITLLRHWPRERFDRGAVSFADVLADATGEAEAPPQPDPSREAPPVAWAAPPPLAHVALAVPLSEADTVHGVPTPVLSAVAEPVLVTEEVAEPSPIQPVRAFPARRAGGLRQFQADA